MQLYAEVGIAQMSKAGEELCGDNVDMVRTGQDTIIVLSDGLGSGVKANILSTLTTKIASSMLKRGIPLEDVVNTIAETLPVCRLRKIAYSTLHILKISSDGLATIVEFDCPTSFLIRNRQVIPFPLEEKQVGGKTIKEGQLLLEKEDIIVAVSDGVIHAGIGGLLKLGWGWFGIAKQLEEECAKEKRAEKISKRIIECCEGYYLGKPGDDSTIITVKMRLPQHLTLFTGPPVDSINDAKLVQRFLKQQGKKVVAGGTTANIISRVTGKPLTVELSYDDSNIPPIGYIEGIDLVTEGVLTLSAATDKIQQEQEIFSSNRKDGATQLARLLLECDCITILAGRAMNPAHQSTNLPLQMNIKTQVLYNLQTVLLKKGKKVSIEWF